jgi:chitinase
MIIKKNEKTYISYFSLHIIIVILLLISSLSATLAKKKPAKVIVAYVTSWTSDTPDPTQMTHINYAFGHVNDTFNGVRIDNETRLQAIVDLKKKHAHLKVLLSIGGWGSGRFSEMASDMITREQFAQDCARVVKQFHLDGIDIDWEYPTNAASGISAHVNDTDNFSLLMKDIRKAIGTKKLLTMASVASGKYVAFDILEPYLNFVNIMTYDSGYPPYHHASLYRSAMSGNTTCEEAVTAHIAAGMPAHKLVLGIPFYGRGNKQEVKSFIDYKDLLKLQGLEKKWDDVAKANYLVNQQGEFVLSYESPESIKLKCNFILTKGLLGAMYWEYASDTDEGILRSTVYTGIFE